MLALLSLFFVPSVALGQTEEASEETIAEARGLFEAGRGAYAQGRYAQALEYFEQSYALLEIPEVLYNVGETAARAAQLDRAIEAFTRYIEMVPTSPDVDALRERIHELERERDAQVSETEIFAATPEPVEEEPAPVEAEPSGDDLSPLGISLIIAGGAFAIGGVPLWVVGEIGNGEVESAPDGAEWSRYRADYEAGPLLTGVGITALVVGVVAAGAGLAILLTREERVSVALGLGGAMLRVDL